MALLGHRVLVLLLVRAERRAALPIAYTGGDLPGPRISPANALPLGATSSGELIDFELTTALEPEDFQQRLKAQLPKTLPIYQVEAVPLKGKSATQSLAQATYILMIEDLDNAETAYPQSDWSNWIQAVLDCPEIIWQHTTKSGKKQSVNLRDRLFDLKFADTDAQSLLPEQHQSVEGVALQYTGSCRNDGTLLRPTQLVYMLEQVSGQTLTLRHIHRRHLILNDASES
ncbi:MAG: TIGR03936 family radical SAM-associated protein, partial [Leptolyngbyaceae cyanobacterium]